LAVAETVEQLVRQDQLATTHNSHLLLQSVVAVAVPIFPALPQVDLAVAPAHQMTSSPEPMAHQDKVSRAEIRRQLITRPMAQVVVDQEAWAKMV
jgi:hypothetical protein